jgi:hypothetical protein
MQILSSNSATYNRLKIPSTPSVKRHGSEAGTQLLHLQIYVLGATTKATYNELCDKCKEREGNRGAFPDFHAPSNILVPQGNSRVVVAFTLACLSEHRDLDPEYW